MFAEAFTAWGSPVTWLEIVAFAMAIAMVFLNMRVNPLAWPLAIGSSILYLLLFAHHKLYGEAGLQVMFAVVGCWGWWQWQRGTQPDGRLLAVRDLSVRGRWIAFGVLLAAWPALALLLDRATDSDVPWWDAFPTAGSLIGQWLLGRKYIENWPAWVAVNIASVALFAIKGLWLTVLLYAIFVVLSFAGWRAPARRIGMIVAILGAESTGKTTLAGALGAALGAAVVPEYLREFCDRARRTPRADEQAAIAAEQMRRIAAARAAQPAVVADTTALQIAVYSELVFGDTSLYEGAIAAHRDQVDLTLLTAIDLPWQPDGLQRDGPQVREPVDVLLRSALQRGGIGHSIVAGAGDTRLQHALAAIERHRSLPRRGGARWHWVCERCGEAACERHLLARG